MPTSVKTELLSINLCSWNNIFTPRMKQSQSVAANLQSRLAQLTSVEVYAQNFPDPTSQPSSYFPLKKIWSRGWHANKGLLMLCLVPVLMVRLKVPFPLLLNLAFEQLGLPPPPPRLILQVHQRTASVGTQVIILSPAPILHSCVPGTNIHFFPS